MTLSAWLLASPRPQFLFAGGCLGILVCCRISDIFLAAGMLLWVVRYQPTWPGRTLAPPTLLGGLLLAYNLYCFGSITWGQAALEALHSKMHAVENRGNPTRSPA